MGLFQRAAKADEKMLSCPRDGVAMEKLVAENVTLDRCASCSGTWFDHGELRRVAHDREVEALASRIRQVRVASGFACPRCAGECIQSFVGDVEVDTCVGCRGVWLDRRELDEAKRQVEVNRVLSDSTLSFRRSLARL